LPAYDNPIPSWFLVPIECLKIPALDPEPFCDIMEKTTKYITKDISGTSVLLKLVRSLELIGTVARTIFMHGWIGQICAK
jgi:hypothetical protein